MAIRNCDASWRLLGQLSWSLPAALTLVGVTAMLFDLVAELNFRRRLGAEPEAVAAFQDVGDALRAAAAHGPVLIQGLRYRSLGYFFMPYIPLVLLGAREEGTGKETDEKRPMAMPWRNCQ